ncbi:MAG: T9SS type A sorting domain-containing protein [Chloroherpetonaceae bacterium]
MQHKLTRLTLLLFGLLCLETFSIHAQTYFSEPFDAMTDVGLPSDSLVAPAGWTAERVTVGITSPIATPPRVSHRTSPTSSPARISGNGARDFEIATRVSTGEWVVNRPSPNNFFVNDTVQTSGTKPPPAFTPVGTTALWFNDWFAAGSGTGGRNVRRLYSPAFDLSTSSKPRVKFKYFYNTGSFALRVLASSDGGVTWNVIASAPPTGTANWQFAGGRIPDDYKVPNARIALEAVNAWSSHDAWIDSLVVEESSTAISTASGGNWSNPATWSLGQVPQPGDDVFILPGATVTIDVPVNVQSLSIRGTLDFNTITTNTLTVSGTLGISFGATLNLFNGANGRTLNLGGDLIIDGTANFSRNNAALVMNGISPQTITGSGLFTGTPVGVIRLLAIANPAGVTIAPTANPINISSTLNLANGVLNTNGRLSIDNTIDDGVTTANCVVQRGVGAITGGLNIGLTALYNLSYTLFTGTTPTPIVSGPEIPPSRSVNNLTYQFNSGGVTIIGGPLEVRGTLTFGTNATFLNMNGQTLTLGTSPTARGTLTPGTTGRIIFGKFRRWFNAATAATGAAGDFPVGTGSARQNIRIEYPTVASAPTAGGTLTAEFISSDPGNAGLPLTDGSLTLDRVAPDGYWTVTQGDGLTGGTSTVTIQPREFGGISDVSTLRIVHRPLPLAPWGLLGSAGTNSGTTSAPSVVRTGVALTATNEFGLSSDATNQLPVELTAFEGAFKNGEVHLSWRTASELNNAGFEIERSVDRETFTQIGFVRGNGTTTEAQSYSFVDRSTFNTEKVYYRLKQVDFDGQFEYSNIIEVSVSLPTKFSLAQNYPNPFNPTTSIAYELPRTSRVVLKVYDVLGREVTTLINEEQSAGRYVQTFNASNLSSGIYFYRLQAGNFVETKKMMLVK